MSSAFTQLHRIRRNENILASSTRFASAAHQQPENDWQLAAKPPERTGPKAKVWVRTPASWLESRRGQSTDRQRGRVSFAGNACGRTRHTPSLRKAFPPFAPSSGDDEDDDEALAGTKRSAAATAAECTHENPGTAVHTSSPSSTAALGRASPPCFGAGLQHRPLVPPGPQQERPHQPSLLSSLSRLSAGLGSGSCSGEATARK